MHFKLVARWITINSSCRLSTFEQLKSVAFWISTESGRQLGIAISPLSVSRLMWSRLEILIDESQTEYKINTKCRSNVINNQFIIIKKSLQRANLELLNGLQTRFATISWGLLEPVFPENCSCKLEIYIYGHSLTAEKAIIPGKQKLVISGSCSTTEINKGNYRI